VIENGVLAQHVAMAVARGAALIMAIARPLQFAAAEALTKHVCQEQDGIPGSSMDCPLVKATRS